MSIFLGIVLASLVLVHSSAKNLNILDPLLQTERLKRDDRCADKITLNDCPDPTGDTSWPIFPRPKTNRFLGVLHTNCPFDTIDYRWVIYGPYSILIAQYKTGTDNVLVFKPFALKESFYTVNLYVKITRKGTTFEIETACPFEVIALPPIPLIKGGTEITAPEGVKFELDGTGSIDRDVPPGERGKLSFKWNCQVLEGYVKGACLTEVKGGNILIVPSEWATKGNKFIFILSVKSKNSAWVSTNQTVTVLSGAALLEIICEKNCPPISKTSSKRVTFLRAVCRLNCESIVESSYYWTVEGESFDYKKSTEFGQDTDRFVIKEDVLKPGEIYKFRVKLKNQPGSSVTVLEVEELIKIKSCQVVPQSGTALETRFKVKCDYTGQGYTFEIFTVKKNNKVVLSQLTNIENIEFVLPINVEVYIKISDIDNFDDVYKLTVDVKAQTKTIADLTGSVEAMVKMGSTDSAMQTINGIIEEKETTEQDKKVLLGILHGVTMRSQEDARQVASVVSRLVHDPARSSNPDRGETATKICKEAAQLDLFYLSKEQRPEIFAKEIRQSTEMSMRCAETDSKENLEMLKASSDFQITTAFPLLPVPVIEEQYPDYVDDSVAIKRKKYGSISQNFVDICKTSLKMMSLSVAVGEGTKTVLGDSCSVQITRSLGKKLVGSDIALRGASFRASRDLENVDDAIDVRVCSWEKNPFWWDSAHTVVSTNVVLLKLTRKEEELHDFDKPNEIVLDAQIDRKIHDVENSNESIVRIDVKKGEAFFIAFHDLTSSDNFRVLISYFEKPESDRVLKEGKVVTKSDNFLYQQHDDDSDGWYYLSVLPQMGMYKLSVYTKSCYSWSASLEKWQFACKANHTKEEARINCQCYHLSILAGIVYNNPIRTEILLSPEFEMVLISSPIIFIALGTILIIYSLLLIIFMRKVTIKGTKIFIPADISTSLRYVYLIGIQTGKKPSSGTTSNICVKIFGDRHQSKSHILNYPDPQKKILQWGNKDWFVVPTRFRLGNLTTIALWSDCTGRSPRWYCSNVTIYDLQSDQKWYFELNTWFDLLPNGQVYVNVPVCDKKEKERRFSTALWRILPKRTHQTGFSNFLKLTLLLSIFLSIFVICLLLYGVPRLTLSDGFIEFDRFKWHPVMVWVGIVSAIVTFLSHLVLIRFFRVGEEKKLRKYCWFLLILNVAGLITILLVFGFWVPILKGYFWLTSVTIGSIFYFFILENIYEFIMMIIAYEKKTESVSWVQNPKILEPIETQRLHLFKTFGENLLRPYFTHLYKALDEEGIKERRLQIESKKKILILLEDTVMFTCYVILLYLAIYLNKNPLSIENYKEIEELLSGSHTRTMAYHEITSVEDIYGYINETLIPTIHAHQWYTSFMVKDPGILADFHNKILGVVRLRQKRVSTFKCQVPKVLKILKNGTCRLEFWDSKDDYTNFGGNQSDLGRFSEIWKYVRSNRAGYSVYVGKFGVYTGGGFIALLGRTWFNSYSNLVYLKNNSWIDGASAAIMIEFLIYNVNSNLFSAVKMVLERSASGFIRTRLDLSTYQFIFVKNEHLVAEIVIFSSFILVVVIFSFKILARIFRSRFLVFADLWFLVDLLLVGMSYGCFALSIHRSASVGRFLEKLKNTPKNEFVIYFDLIYEEAVFISVAAILVFVATVRLWKVFRFGTIFKIMEKTVILSISPIFIVLLSHLIMVTGFCLSGNLIFSAESESFKDISSSLLTLMLLTTGFQNYFDFGGLVSSYEIFGRIFYSAYMFLNLFFLTMYVAVIMNCYYDAKISSDESGFSTVRHFVAKEMAFYKTYLRIGFQRLKGGTTKRKKLVTPKPDEIRYANCMTLPSNTLELMCCIAIHELKKFKLNQEEKLWLMDRVVLCSGDDDNLEVFYDKKCDGLIDIIYDGKVRRVAAAAEKILSYDKKKRERTEKIYQKITAYQLMKIDFVLQVLNTAVRVISNIEIQ